MKRMYAFQNPTMQSDIVDAKGRVVIYAKMAVIAAAEVDARTVYGSQVVGTDKKGDIFRIEDQGPLSDEWECTGVYELGASWN